MRKPHQGELETLVRWFADRMKPEDRRALMGELPVHYKLLYPGVPPETIAANVIAAITFAEEESRDPLPRSRSI